MNDTEQKIPDATADEDRESLTFVMTNMYLKPRMLLHRTMVLTPEQDARMRPRAQK